MTLDPYFSEKGDLVLPGEGVFGMRDGNLSQVASSVSRPLDEMLMYDMPGAEYLAENVTDKIAFQGPEMLPPEGSGLGYMVPMTIGAVRGIGIPALKAGYKVGKSGYNLGSDIYSGILSNLQ